MQKRSILFVFILVSALLAVQVEAQRASNCPVLTRVVGSVCTTLRGTFVPNDCGGICYGKSACKFPRIFQNGKCVYQTCAVHKTGRVSLSPGDGLCPEAVNECTGLPGTACVQEPGKPFGICVVPTCALNDGCRRGCSPPDKDCSTACPLDYDPVCGTDGKTYPNSCNAKVAEVKYTKGACPLCGNNVCEKGEANKGRCEPCPPGQLCIKAECVPGTCPKDCQACPPVPAVYCAQEIGTVLVHQPPDANGCPRPDKCAQNLCTNGIKDWGETAVDCGGSTCAKCIFGKSCITDKDCSTNFCNPVTKKCTGAI